jgi:hypothetical protein
MNRNMLSLLVVGAALVLSSLFATNASAGALTVQSVAQLTAAPVLAGQLGQSTLTCLTISASARDEALGGTGCFSDGSAVSAFMNPSGLGRIEGGSAFMTNTAWLADITMYDLAVAYRFGNVGTFAITARSMDLTLR